MIVGVSMVKDEEDIIGTILEHLLAEGVDRFIIADNMSTDGTRDILESFPQVHVVEDTEPGYYQSEKVTRLARMAHEIGADWVLPFDADELWYSSDGRRICDVLAPEVEIYWVEGYYHIPRPDDPPGDPVHSMVHRREGRDCPQAKVMFRPVPDVVVHMGNHDVVHPGERVRGTLSFREFQYRSFDHFCRKVRNGKRAYDAGDIHEGYGIHWRRLGAMSDEQLAEEWAAYLATPTVYDPAPVRSLAKAG